MAQHHDTNKTTPHIGVMRGVADSREDPVPKRGGASYFPGSDQPD